MLQQRDTSTFLKRLGTGPKLWLSLGLIFFIILVKNLYLAIALMAVSIFMIVREKQFTLFKVILVTMTILFISMYGIYGAMAPVIDKSTEPVWFTIGSIRYYQLGFEYAARYYFRVAPLMCSLFLLFLTMDMTDLGVIMCNIGIPYRLVFTFIDSFQVITLLNKDMEQIRDAQRARGLNTEGNVLQRFKAFVPIMVPVVANSIIKVQDQAIAMDTKGFNSTGKKTVYRELKYTTVDQIVRVAGILLFVGSVAYRILVKAAAIQPFLTNIM